MMENNKSQRWWDLPAILFLFTSIWLVVWRIQATKWTSDLYRLEVLVLIGYLLGLFLGRSKFHKSIVRWIALIYTLFFIPWQLGLMLGRDISWLERLQSLWGRLQYSSTLFAGNQPVEDPLLFLTAMSILYWLLSLTAGYMLVRYAKPWVPLLLAGSIMFVIDFYHSFFGLRAWFDGGYVLLALMLVSRVYFMHSRKIWDDRGAVLDPEVGLNLGGTVFVSSLVLILIAWNFPLFIDALTPGTEVRERVQIAWTGLRNRLGNAVAGLSGTPVYEAAAYSNQLRLGTGGRLSDELVFTVEPSQVHPSGKRYYWRGYSYNHYSLGYWRSTLEYIDEVGPREWEFNLPSWQGRRRVQFTFTPETRLQRTIFSPTYPISASRATRLLLANEVGVFDPLSLQSETPLRPGELILVDAYISVPSIKQMRESSTDYPEWISERYLELPNDLPPRIKSLAQDVTRGSDTQYDRVIAITQYLRENYDYQEIIPSAPRGRDPVDWFLFDLRKGFCNYYATAEILMLRSIGIPARLSVGYAEGEIDPNSTNAYQVRERDSHAWPEVFFNDIGWVEFEPTASEPVIVYPSGINDNFNEYDDERMLERDRPYPDSFIPPMGDETAGPAAIKPQSTYANLTAYLILCFALGVFFWLAFGQIKFRYYPIPVLMVMLFQSMKIKTPGWLEYWAWWGQLSPIEKLYEQLGGLVRMAGGKVVQGQTPSERLAVLTRLVPDIQLPGIEFLEEYQLAEYGRHPANYTRARYAFTRLEKKVFSIWLRRILRL